MRESIVTSTCAATTCQTCECGSPASANLRNDEIFSYALEIAAIELRAEADVCASAHEGRSLFAPTQRLAERCVLQREKELP